MEHLKKNSNCRSCKGSSLQKVISLGSMPPANAFLKKEDLNSKEPSFPLEVYFCKNCGFVQLVDIVDPELLFRNYVYVSSTSPVFIQHFKELAGKIVSNFKLPKNSLVIDIGSNDGILLRPFKDMGMKVLGIDPAEKIAEIATKSGIETMPVFFNSDVARNIAKAKGKAKLVCATSVFSHVDNLDEFLDGVNELLDEDGVFLIEVYYLKELLEKNLFDTIYHEHLSYFTAKTMSALMERKGLELFDAEVTDTHGATLRAYVQKKNGTHQISKSVNELIKKEDEKHLNELDTYIKFSHKIDSNKKALLELLKKLKSQNKRIVGYGAPAKGNTLLNYFGIGPDILDYIVDDSSWKQGLYSPGMRIPVVSAEHLSKQKPDYIFILAWNFAKPIMKKLDGFDRFIIPVPVPSIVSSTVEQDLDEICQAIKEEAKKLEGSTVLVTGGAGFIGSYIVAVIDTLNNYYLKNPCKVISVDNHLVGKKNNLIKEIYSGHVDFVTHDVCTPFKHDGEVDYIISAAGVASPVYYKKIPDRNY